MDSVFKEALAKLDLEVVCRDHGINFTNGKALCPFIGHDDKNASFSLHPSKSYVHCFGCNKGGDAIGLEYELGRHQNQYEALKALNQRYSLNLKLNGWDEKKAKDYDYAFQLLHWYCEKAHGSLLKHEEAQQWLESKKGITLDDIRKFKIGFVGDSWLCNKVTDKNRDIFIKLGLVKEKDSKLYDYFRNRLIFPVYNRGSIASVMSREWPDKEGSSYKWLGLPTSDVIPSKPVAFVENLNCDRCVITESIPDALSFLKVDIPAVALLGKDVSCGNREHFDKAKSKLYFALDPDPAGQEAAYKLAREFKGYVVNLGHDEDPDEVLAKVGVEDFRKIADRAINEAKSYLDLLVEKEDKIEALREIAKLEYESDKDIWLKKLSLRHGVTLASLRQDLASVVEKQTREENVEASISTPPKYTEEEIAKANEILELENILGRVLEITSKAGYVGEDRNKKLAYLACTSRKLRGRKKSISLITKGESSSGKSDLVKQILKLMPPGDVKEYTFITEKALVHSKHDLSHKILCVFEREGGEKSDYTLRTAISEEKLSILIPTKNPVTGDFESIEKEIPAVGMVYIETTTEDKTEPQNANRTFEFFTDSSPELTRNVLRSQAKVYKRKESELEQQYRIWQCAQDLLEPLPVYVPFAEDLAEQFPVDRVRARRDYPRLLALIEVSAFLHQKCRERIERGGETFIKASEHDFNIALEIVKPILEQTYKDLSPKEESLVKILKDEFGFGHFNDMDDKSMNGENVFGVTDFLNRVMPRLKSKERKDRVVRDFQANSTVRRYFKNLSEKGILEWNGKTGTASKYVLISDIPPVALHISVSSWANTPKKEKLTNTSGELDSNQLAQNEMSQYRANELIDKGLAQKKGISSPLAQSEMSPLFEGNQPKSLKNAGISSLAHENMKGKIEKIRETPYGPQFKIQIPDENGKPTIQIITSDSDNYERIKKLYEEQRRS